MNCSSNNSSNSLTQNDLLLKKLLEFYKNNSNIDKMLNIINGKNNISLRIIDWFVTNYSKKNNISYHIHNEAENHIEQFIVYLNYKKQLKAYSKKQFDPFCRRERISFFYNSSQELVTTVGQLNFFRWAIENKVLDYIKNNLSSIEEDMNLSVRSIYNKRNQSLKNTKKGGTQNTKVRRKRQELSVSATKSVSKHNVAIIVKFE